MKGVSREIAVTIVWYSLMGGVRLREVKNEGC